MKEEDVGHKENHSYEAMFSSVRTLLAEQLKQRPIDYEGSSESENQFYPGPLPFRHIPNSIGSKPSNPISCGYLESVIFLATV